MTGKQSAQQAGPMNNPAGVGRLKGRFARQNLILVVAFFLLLLLAPSVPGFKGWMAGQVALVIIYIMAAQGVSILTGYTGLVSVGHGGFSATFGAVQS